MQVKHPPQFLLSLDLAFEDPLIRYLQQAYRDNLIDADSWNIRVDKEHEMWLHFHHTHENLPIQGWKLHISADLSSAEIVLQRVFPLLLQEATTFKFASSLQNLEKLNSGAAGESQIGKFITIYPRNDDEAVSLAARLDQATQGLSGPCVPSDRMLRPDSLVFYRYGGYDSKIFIQELVGQVWPAIETPDKQLIPDKRSPKYHAPTNRKDPFLASGVATDLPKAGRVLAQRYLIISVISATINHTVSLAIDLKNQRTCIVKSTGRVWQNRLPESVRENTRQEANVLRELVPCPRIPIFFDLLEQDNNISLIISDIPGQLLMERISKECTSGRLSIQQIVTWGRDLAEILETIHQKGFVYADLKPTNLIIGPDEKLYLIDFELADRKWAPGKAQNGTRGYMSPQQFAGQPRSIADDIYSFGALLYLLVTGTEPSFAPDPFGLLKRPVEAFRWDVPLALIRIIIRCLQQQPEARYTSMREIIAAFDTAGDEQQQAGSLHESPSSTNNPESKTRAHATALALLHTLCIETRKPENGEGLTWKTTHPLANHYALRDLNTGLAGTILALAGLVANLDEPGAREILAQGANWLRATRPHSDPPLPGLYIGEAGVGAALLLTGQVLADSTLIDAAVERGRCIAAQPHTSPDIIHGTAGRLLFHLLLWEETREKEHLTAALACGKHLLETAQTREQGETCWTIPAQFQGFGRHAYPGYAHGAAGIADMLLDLFEVTGDERFIPPIQGAANWLQRLAIPVLADQSGLSWPVTEERDTPSLPFWCHGSTGIGRFFLHANRHTWLPGTLKTAVGAAQSVIHLARSAGPTLCHGLAGGIEFLLDMYQETREQFYLTEAQSFGKLLQAFEVEREGRLFFHSDQYNVFSPDYLVGYAGIAISFLRLSTPEHLPYQLSRAGFQAYKQRAE